MNSPKAWSYLRNANAYTLICAAKPPRSLEPNEVRVRVKACSLNYRDLIALGNKAGRKVDGRIPLSDGAGMVTEVGRDVARWKIGDRVAACFFQTWLSGRFRLEYHQQDLGGTIDGMLAEEVILNQDGLVALPTHLSYREAATLPCAAVTAWQALIERGSLKNEETVLVLGTGGVSIFALQIARALGARVIVTSSQAGKLEQAKQLGAWATIDTTLNPDWDRSVWELTDHQGVDHIIETGGPGTLERSMKSIAAGGQIHLIGVLSGFGPPTASLFPLLARNVTLHGLYVGSRQHFDHLNAFLERHALRPWIDRVFPFDEAPQAFGYLEAANHIGKIVIDGSDA